MIIIHEKTYFLAKCIQNITYIVLMTFTGNKSSETILGSHACRFEKLENFAITFSKKPTFKNCGMQFKRAVHIKPDL